MEKLKMVFLITVCLSLSVPCFARKNIELAGSWKRSEKSISPKLPILVWLEDNNKDLMVHFLENLGPIDIRVIALDGNIIYSNTLDAVELSTYKIAFCDNDNIDGCQIIVTNKFNMVNGLIILEQS